MKPTKTKAQIRSEIEAQIEAYLSSGGEVDSVPRGISGNTDNSNLFTATTFEPKQERTPLNEVVKELEERKKTNTSASSKRQTGPRRKLIKDDFGEPIRWVWLDK